MGNSHGTTIRVWGLSEAGSLYPSSSGDGVKTVSGAFEVRCTNWVPNELISVYSDTTTLDTHRPTTFALGNVTCKKGGKAVFHFRVTHNLSPKATVTIVIKKGSKTAKTCKVGKRANGQEGLPTPSPANLARGHYKFIVKKRRRIGRESPGIARGSRSLTVT